MALLALLVLVHALVATTRARQRDLAVLRTLGFERRHLSATVAWQATAIALLGVLVGGVFGIAVTTFDGEQQARAAAEADPVIQARAGFSFEIHPMPFGAVRR